MSSSPDPVQQQYGEQDPKHLQIKRVITKSSWKVQVMDNAVLAPSEYEYVCIMDEAVYKCHNHKMTCRALDSRH